MWCCHTYTLNNNLYYIFSYYIILYIFLKYTHAKIRISMAATILTWSKSHSIWNYIVMMMLILLYPNKGTGFVEGIYTSQFCSVISPVGVTFSVDWASLDRTKVMRSLFVLFRDMIRDIYTRHVQISAISLKNISSDLPQSTARDALWLVKSQYAA